MLMNIELVGLYIAGGVVIAIKYNQLNLVQRSLDSYYYEEYIIYYFFWKLLIFVPGWVKMSCAKLLLTIF